MAREVTKYLRGDNVDIGRFPAGGEDGHGNQTFNMKFTYNGKEYDIGKYFFNASSGTRTVNSVNGNLGFTQNGVDISTLLCAEGYLNCVCVCNCHGNCDCNCGVVDCDSGDCTDCVCDCDCDCNCDCSDVCNCSDCAAACGDDADGCACGGGCACGCAGAGCS